MEKMSGNHPPALQIIRHGYLPKLAADIFFILVLDTRTNEWPWILDKRQHLCLYSNCTKFKVDGRLHQSNFRHTKMSLQYYS